MDSSSRSDWSLSHNGFYGNASGHFSDGVEASDTVEEDPRVALYSQDGVLENDRLVFLDGSPYRDAGDPEILDPDGSRSDLGANGGPGAQWIDDDGDGYSTGFDCDDQDPEVFPGAEDPAYDGLNQDCGWGSDFDQDGDGEDALDYGGSDCDDTNPQVQETCGEELDTGEPSVEEESADCGCSSSSTHGRGLVSFSLVFLAGVLARRTREQGA